MKGISSNYIEIIEFIELTPDHIPVLLTSSSNVIKKKTQDVAYQQKKQPETFSELI